MITTSTSRMRVICDKTLQPAQRRPISKPRPAHSEAARQGRECQVSTRMPGLDGRHAPRAPRQACTNQRLLFTARPADGGRLPQRRQRAPAAASRPTLRRGGAPASRRAPHARGLPARSGPRRAGQVASGRAHLRPRPQAARPKGNLVCGSVDSNNQHSARFNMHHAS